MDVMIDISENLKHVNKISVLGVSDELKKHQFNIRINPFHKKGIKKYPLKIPLIYAIMVSELIIPHLPKYSSIQICNDVSANKLMNHLNKIFKKNKEWISLKKQKLIKIKSTKRSQVDKYVKGVRLGKIKTNRTLKLKELNNLIIKHKKK